MSKISFFSQILMIVLAVLIVMLYIKPKISEIRMTQDLLSSYETETENVSRVNEDLKSKIAQIDAITPEDAKALARFIPDTVDDISTLKDISAIVEAGGVTDYVVNYKGVLASASDNSQENEGIPVKGVDSLIRHNFALDFSGSYSQLKNILSLIESNDYILQVSNMQAADTEGILKVSLTLTSFSRTAVVNPSQN
jgi:hypothetical protein